MNVPGKWVVDRQNKWSTWGWSHAFRVSPVGTLECFSAAVVCWVGLGWELRVTQGSNYNDWSWNSNQVRRILRNGVGSKGLQEGVTCKDWRRRERLRLILGRGMKKFRAGLWELSSCYGERIWFAGEGRSRNNAARLLEVHPLGYWNKELLQRTAVSLQIRIFKKWGGRTQGCVMTALWRSGKRYQLVA